MSKNLRVFLLSVFVVILGISSAFAASLPTYTITMTDTNGDGNLDVVDADGKIATNDEGNHVAWYDETTGILCINANGRFTFVDKFNVCTDASSTNGEPVIHSVMLNSINGGADDGDNEVSNAVLVVPTPYPTDSPAQGTGGQWIVTWPTQRKNSSGIAEAVSKTNRVKFRIEKRSTNSAILITADLPEINVLADGGVSFGEGCDLEINAPFRVNDDLSGGTPLKATISVPSNATVMFDREAEIFSEGTAAKRNYPSGYSDSAAASTYDVAENADLIIRNTWALRGDNLTVNVDPNGTLTFDLPSGTIHDLRDRWDAYSGSDVVDGTAPGTTLNIDDGFIRVLSDMTLYGKIVVPDSGADGKVINKNGSGKLTLSDSTNRFNILPKTGNIYEGSLPLDLAAVNILAGTLEFASESSWQSDNAGTNPPVVNVSSGAFFVAKNESMRQANDDRPFVFKVAGTATFENHAIVMNENEIYPYENFVSLNNGIIINARDTVLNVESTGKVIVKDGGFAAGKIAGKGTIEINNTATNEDASKDIAVLILTRPLGVVEAVDANGVTTAVTPVANINNENYARSYIDFEGKITGTHANVGLYVASSTEDPYSRRIFRSADVDIENIIVYGPAELNVDANTNLDGVGNVWLRGHRPGAANFNADGSVNAPVAYAKLTVGKLNFIPGERNSEININGLKVDGSSSYEDMGSVNVLVYDNDTKNGTTVAIANVNATASTAPQDYSALDANGEGANRATKAIGPRLTANISNLQLYANKGTNKDFPTKYANPSTGIYALRINGTEQPSRVVIDGTTVTGDGLAADVTNKVHQIEIISKSDVRFTGNAGAEYYPVANNNSIMVRHDAKLEIDRGAIVGGHLTFEPSSVAEWPTFGSHVDDLTDYPADEDFIADEGWYDGANGTLNGAAFTNNGRINGPTINDTLDYPMAGYLDNYTAFTTQVGDRNRRDNEAGEYAVTVKGDLTLARDEFEGYSGRGQVLVRVKPDLSAYDSHEFTTIAKRFKVIGSEAGEGGNYYSDFATSFNRFFLFRIPSDKADTRGVTVENRDELAIVTLDDWSFMRGGDDFGLGDGHDFSIRVPFTIMYRDEEVTIQREVTKNNDVRFVLGLGTNKYYIAGYPVFFTYDEGMASSAGNVSDITALTTLATITNDENRTYVSDDITVRAEFDVEDGEQFIRLIGTSYSGENPVKLNLALYLVNVTTGKATWLDGVVPAFRELTLVRDGVTPPDTGTQYSSAKTEAVGRTDFTVSEDALVSFRVEGVRRATYEGNSVSSAPEFVDGNYVWNVNAETGTYYMQDSQGKEARVTDLVVVRYDGNYLRRTTTATDIDEGFTLTVDADGALITLPASLLGTTGSAFNAEKGLALKAKRIDSTGEIITKPVTYALHSPVAPENVVLAAPLNNVVTKGGASAHGVYDIPLTDFSGDINPNNIKLIPYSLPAWLGFYGNGGTISYQTGDLTGVESGTYNFQVLAYVGDNASTSQHKLYTFTVTVMDPVQPHIEGEATINVVVDGTQTSTLTFVSGDATVVTWSIADNTNPAGLLTGSASGNTYTLTANAAGVAAGSYEYTVNANAGAYTYKVTVVVSDPVFEIVEETNGFADYPIENRTYTATYTVSGATDVSWTFTNNTRSDVHSYKSGDVYIVEGVAKVAQDADDSDIDQTFSVAAEDKPTGRKADAVETTFTVTAEDDTITFAALTPASGTHDAVSAGYLVNFPAGVTADADAVWLPGWLEPVMGTTEDTEGYVIGIRFAGVAGDLENNTKATVRVEAYNEDGDAVYYGWDVTYNAKPADLVITPSNTTVTFESPTAAAQTVTMTSNFTGGTMNYTVAVSPSTGLNATVSGDVITLTPSAVGTYTVTVTGNNVYDTATTTVNVTVSPEPSKKFSITANPASVTFESPTAAAQTVTMTSNLTGATVTYTAEVDKTGLTAAVSGNVLTLTPSAAGSYVVTVTGTANGQTATATVNVTVSNGSAPADFSISANPSTLTFTSPSAAAQTVTLSANLLGATVTYTAAVTTGSETGLYLEVSGSTLTVDPLAAGTYVVTVTGTNGERTATATVNVTVSNGSTPSSFSISASPSTLTFTSPSAAAQTVTLSANLLGATVTYTAEVTSGSEDGLVLDVTGNTLTVDPLAAGIYAITVTGTNGVDTATATVNVTVSAAARVGSSGGGCDAGFGALALILAAPLFLRRRRS